MSRFIAAAAIAVAISVGHDIGTMVGVCLCRALSGHDRAPGRPGRTGAGHSPLGTIDEAIRTYYAKLCARRGAMPSAFAQFLSFPKDADDNRKAIATRLGMPVLAIGGGKYSGATQAVVMRNAATDVSEVVIPDAGHWLMEEAPGPTMAAIERFVDGK